MNSGQWVLAGVCALMAVGGVALFISAFGRMKLRRTIEDTPTSKIRSAPMGKVELKGLGKILGKPAIGPFSGAECVWYRFLVEEEKTSTDSKGNARKSWERVADGVSSGPFLLDDLSADIVVLPDGAEVDAPKVFTFTEGGIFSVGKIPGGPLFAQHRGSVFSGRRRFSEWRLEIQQPLYVLGVLRPAREGERVAIGRGRAEEPFFISSKSESELIQGMFWGVIGRFVFGAGLTLGGMAMAAHYFLGW